MNSKKYYEAIVDKKKLDLREEKNMYLITNANIITESGILKDSEIIVRDGYIEKIGSAGELDRKAVNEIIDAEGGYLAPGFVDIHSDYIETMAAPRPTSMMDFKMSLRETEKILVNQGITTMFHSLSLYKRDDFSFKPIRFTENVRKLMNAIEETHNNKHLIRHRFHARFEIDNVDEVENLKTYIKDGKVHLISFMDHSPGQGQYRNLEIYRNTLKGYRDLSDKEVDTIIDEHNKEKCTIETINDIAKLAHLKKISVASHDDDSSEKIELVSNIGAKISEFPITMNVAKEAKKAGMYTMVGAPNVLMGGSHSGNLSAAEAIQMETADILCSDYYPPAMLHAVFTLHEKHGQELHKMFNLVTINPAKAVNMDDTIGSIKEGKKADLLIIKKIEGDFPVITTVLVDGKVISRIHYRI
jgi:alpha-D-ribose 1-methylphosphonate 5-triphosphate diphosphatase